MAKGFDTDRGFMLVEIAGDQFYFQTVSRTGANDGFGRHRPPAGCPKPLPVIEQKSLSTIR